MSIDDRLREGLASLAPADPSGAYEKVVAKHVRRRVLRKAQAGVLVVAVVVGSAFGFYGLSRAFRTGPSHVAATASNGRIAFTDWYTRGLNRIFTVDPDGTDVRDIGPKGMEEADFPSWSPDGSRLVFSGLESPQQQAVYIFRANGSGLSKILSVPPNEQIEALHWSPDGSRIGYALDQMPPRDPQSGLRLSRWTIWTMAPDGSNPRQVTTTGREMHFSWSPDGTRIVFDRFESVPNDGWVPGASTDLFVVNVDGTDETRLTTGGESSDPAWSPDGTQIAFEHGSREGPQHVAVIPSSGGEVRDLESAPPTSRGASAVPYGNTVEWSPDGTTIAFVRTNDRRSAILTIDLNSGRISRLVSSTRGSPGALGMSWAATMESATAPSETFAPAPTDEPSVESTELGAGPGSIAVTWAHGFPSGELDLGLVSTDDGTLTRLTSGTELDSSPAWSPDGSTIAFWRMFRQRSSPDGIYTMPPAGGEPTLRLETDLSISSISWSPQGDRIAFVGLQPRNGSELDSPSDVYTIAADGTGLRQVTSGGHVADVAWSPDGAQLALTKEHALGGSRIGTDIYVLDLVTGQEQRLTHDGTAWKPSWSPDGTRIAFEAGQPGRVPRNDLFVMDADGSHRTRLTSTPEDEEDTAWAPDGTDIAVTRYVIGGVRDCDLVIVAADGSAERILLDGPIDGACPTSLSWEPLSG